MADKERMVKMAVIAGAAHALRIKNENRFITDSEVLKQITQEMTVILEKIDVDDN